MPRAIVTRPATEGQVWVENLRAFGVDAVSLPLITIHPVADKAALVHAWAQLDRYDAVMFVSGNAASHFFAQQAAQSANTWRPSLRAWVTGPGSQSVLQACGVERARIDAPGIADAQFDSEALWRVVRPQVGSGTRVLIVRGRAASRTPPMPSVSGTGRDWLAQQIEAAGGGADFVVAYERRAPVWGAAELDRVAQAASDGSVWILSSAEGLSYLLDAAPGQGWEHAKALATHPRIAAAARQAGFGWVHETRPVLADLVASIESQA